MAYIPINWENLPSTKTPINAENLKHMDEGIAQAHDANRLLEIYKANSIKQKLSGEVITSKDCANVPPLGIKLFGKGTQKIVPGNQLFDASKFETTTIGNFTLTNNGDGSLTIGGEGALTQGVDIRYRLTHEETVKMLKAGKIHLQAGAITYPYLNIGLKHANGHYCGLYNNTVAYNNANITEEMINDETCYLEIVLYGSSGGQSITPVTIKPMLYQDGDGTWEPFVGGEQSPSMNYPQIPVFHGESGSIGGKVLNDNLFGGTGYTLFPLYLKKDTEITVSCSDIATTVFGIYDVNQKRINYWTINEIGNGRYYKNIKLSQDIHYVMFDVWNARESKEYKLELGTVATPYKSYTEQPFTALTPNGLKGVPMSTTGNYVDGNGQLWVADYVDFQKGVLVQQPIKKCVFDGTEAWQLLSGQYFAIVSGDYPYAYSNIEGAYCSHALYGWDGVFCGIDSNSGRYVAFKCPSGFEITESGLEKWKTFLAEQYAKGTPVTLWYLTKEDVTETPLTQEELDQYNSLVMNYPITNVVNDAGACMEVEYVADTQLHIEQNYVSIDKYNEHENRIAEIEKAMVNS